MASITLVSKTHYAKDVTGDSDRGPLVVGREGDLIPSAHPGLSRRHAMLCHDGAEWTIWDRSRNGTMLNGERLGDELAPLRHGDVLDLGCMGLEFEVRIED